MSFILVALFLQKFISMSIFNEECPRQLRVTLAHFRTYCKKNVNSVARLSTDHNLNSSVTKYRSIRQMKIQELRNDLFSKPLSKKKKEISPKKQKPSDLAVTQTELIQMIKYKLSKEKPCNLRVNTDHNLKEDSHNYHTNKKIPDITSYILRNTKYRKQPKKKKINFSITNTKYDLQPRTTHNQNAKEIQVSLRQRPSSAFPSETRISHFEQPKTQQKMSMPNPHKESTKTLGSPFHQIKSPLNQKGRQICGWEITNLDEQFGVEAEEMQANLLKKKKKKRKG